MKTVVIKFGLTALAVGAFLGSNLSAKAEDPTWVRAQTPNFFKARGLVPPGYFSKKESQKPATVAVSKSGQGLGEQKPASEAGKTRTRHVRSAKGAL